MAAEQPLNRIHVSNLAWTIQEDNLKEIFQEFGNVTVVKIPKRKKGGSKGFGFVTFDTEEAATLAVKRMNNVSVEDRRIGVVYSTSQEKKEKPAVEGAESNRLHIRQLEWGTNGVTDEDLQNEFGKFGTIKAANVKKTSKGASKGYGFVEFDTVDEARAAKDAMDNKELKGRAIRVYFSKNVSRTRREKREKATKATTTKKKTQKKEAKAVEAKQQDGGDAPVPEKQKGGKGKRKTKKKKGGKNKAAGKKEVAQKKKQEEEVVTPAKTPEKTTKKRKPRNKIYCKVPQNATEQTLQQFFALYGNVKKVDIPKKKDAEGIRGHAFVTFDNETESSSAIDTLKANERLLGEMRIVADFARPPNRKNRKPQGGKKQQ